VFIGFPLSLTLSPLLRRGEREFTTRCRLSHSLLSIQLKRLSQSARALRPARTRSGKILAARGDFHL
jgi:hypothetical protein